MRSKAVLLVVAAVFVGVALLVSFAIPRSNNHSPSAIGEPPESQTSAVDLTLTVDSVDAATGSMRMRLQASPGALLPPEGALVVTSVGGIPTIVRDGVNGKLFAPEDARSIATTTREIFNDLERYSHLAQSSFAEYQARLNWRAAGQTVRKLLETL